MPSSRDSRVVAFLVALALTAGATPSHARAPASTRDRTVLAWPLAIDVELAPAAGTELAAAVHTGLARASVTSAEIDAARATEAAACIDDACIVAIARAQGVRWVVRPRVHVDDRNFDIGATLIDSRDGVVLGTVSTTCELCGTAEVAEELANQVATLAGKLARIEPEPARLVLTTDPSGAEIVVDGRGVGRSPQTLSLAAGRHRIEVRKPGFVAVERSFAAVAGVDESLALVLVRSRRPLVGAGLGVLFGGLALTGSGAALWAIDGRAYRRRCSGDDVDYAGRCRYAYDTATAGIVLTSVGIAAIVTGIALLATSRRRTRR